MRLLAAGALCALLLACAPEVTRQPASLATREAGGDQLIGASLIVTSSSGYDRTIPAGSRWRSIGRIAQGEVYRRIDDVFSIEGAHMHEAFLVIDHGRVIGFYLPVEKSFSPARSAVSIDFKGGGHEQAR